MGQPAQAEVGDLEHAAGHHHVRGLDASRARGPCRGGRRGTWASDAPEAVDLLDAHLVAAAQRLARRCRPATYSRHDAALALDARRSPSTFTHVGVGDLGRGLEVRGQRRQDAVAASAARAAARGGPRCGRRPVLRPVDDAQRSAADLLLADEARRLRPRRGRGRRRRRGAADAARDGSAARRGAARRGRRASRRAGGEAGRASAVRPLRPLRGAADALLDVPEAEVLGQDLLVEVQRLAVCPAFSCATASQ